MLRPLYRDLNFNSPLSIERADRLIGTAQLTPGCRVVDLGCGWAELLLRALAAEPTATGVGVDLDEEAIAHGQELADSRGLADRVELAVGDAQEWSGDPADVALSVGASHVFGGDAADHTANTLAAYRKRLKPGGRLLLGEGFWRTPPTPEAMEFFDGDTGQFDTLARLVELAHEHGYRMLAVSEATLDEWDEFQSQYMLGWERHLLECPDAENADEIRAKTDDFRTAYLGAWRGVLGFAYLTLVAPR